MVKNSYGIMKKTFKKLFKRTYLHINIIHDVFIACYFFHNLIMGIKKMDVEKLMQVIQFQGMQDDALNANGLHQSKENVHIQGKQLSK